MAIGDDEKAAGERDEDAWPVLRYYWHLTPAAAVLLMSTATSVLNDAQVPYRLKVLKNPEDYCRADAGVLYVSRRDLAIVAPLVARMHSAVAQGLRPEVPLFTKRMANGLGFAEDVDLSLSFGQHRCQLIAEALWGSFVRGERDRDSRSASLAAAFSREGLDPLHPHRGPGWRPEYEPESLTVDISAPTACAGRSLEAGRPVSSLLSPLEAAAMIGRQLCRSAFWDTEGRGCNWVGRSTAEDDQRGTSITPTTEALRPGVYGGSAGIALFLAQLHNATQEEEFRRTALAAIDRSIRKLATPSTEEPPSPLSFFFGALGVAYVAWRVAVLIGDSEVLDRVDPIIDQVRGAMSSRHDVDVIGGDAGAIPTLLAMSRATGFEKCGAMATVLGEDLSRLDPSCSGVRCARANPEYASELEDFTPSGLSHGAAGIGLALLELHAATGRATFRDAARRAFSYEDTLFERDRGNWADLRRPGRNPRYELAWCNGAPGITLSRLRAAVLDPDRREGYLTMARAGLATTLDAIEKGLAIPRYDATLCHGLTGLIEIVGVAADILHEATYRSRSIEAVRVLIDRYSESGEWPSGLNSGGPNPSLMLGTAGIGYSFLRLHDPATVPSVLWVGC